MTLVRPTRRTWMLLVSLLVASGLLVVPGAGHAAVSDGNPNDPLWPHQWGPRQINAPQAWATTTGDGVTIAIVDSGVDVDHPDLQANIVPGYDAVDGQGNGDWEEGEAHGTHVAGIAGAVGDNNEGVVGVAPDASIMPVRVLDEDGSGSFEDIAEGITWATDHGADVINLSLGALPGVQALVLTGLLTDVEDAIAYANSKGVVVVAAAGNEAFPLCEEPSFDNGVLCVTATDKREAHSAYSDGAIKPDLLAVAAPGGSLLPICGEDVLSTVPPGTGRAEVCGYGDAYDEYAGTSMAAPHAAGTAGLLVSLGCTREQTLDLITSTAAFPLTDEPRGVYDPVYGYGIVDAAAAVTAAGTTCTGGTSTGGSDPTTSTNTAPTALDDSAQTDAPSPVHIEVLANDSDGDGDALSVVGATDPEHGHVSVKDDGRVTYKPDRGFQGTDTFTYTISDGRGGTDQATVTVEVS